MATRFPIRFTGLNRAMVVLAIRRSASYVEVDDDEMRARMSWAFRLRARRSSVHSVAPDHGRVLGWGVHGWRGEWLVNGSSRGIVRVELEPRARGWVIGFPVKVRTLRVAVNDPDGLVSALTH